ncbi:MAG: endonuclease domain-containing protein [Candidatus Uhrbacteria bacterium]|nr:endonuclease domain-containing protein [Candidatus Uhrbacteria bacterium]
MHELFNRFYQKDVRRVLRNEATRAENYLWEHLKNKKLGFKFRRQHGIDSFVVDFYCSEKRLAIELDGSQHFTSEGKTHDEERSRIIEGYEIKVIRFTNDEVINNTNSVISRIKQILAIQPARPTQYI